jgi:hypothetical protein
MAAHRSTSIHSDKAATDAACGGKGRAESVAEGPTRRANWGDTVTKAAGAAPRAARGTARGMHAESNDTAR